MINGFVERQEAEWQRLKWAVWHIAAFAPKYELPMFEVFMQMSKKNNPKE